MSRLRDTGITSGRVVDIVNHKFNVCDKLLHLTSHFFSLSLSTERFLNSRSAKITIFPPFDFILQAHLLNGALRQIDKQSKQENE